MKKAKLVALSLAASVMIMGAGYAWWTDSTTINGTVTTGTFKVEYGTKLTESSGNNKMFHDAIGAKNVDYIDHSISKDDTNGVNKGLKIDFKDLYPGALGTFGFNIVNLGSIPALFDTIGVDFTEGSFVSENVNVTSLGYYITDGEDSVAWVDNQEVQAPFPLKNLQNKLTELTGWAELKPGQSMNIYFSYELPTVVSNGQDETDTFNITMGYKQFNK